MNNYNLTIRDYIRTGFKTAWWMLWYGYAGALKKAGEEFQDIERKKRIQDCWRK